LLQNKKSFNKMKEKKEICINVPAFASVGITADLD